MFLPRPYLGWVLMVSVIIVLNKTTKRLGARDFMKLAFCIGRLFEFRRREINLVQHSFVANDVDFPF